LNGKRSGKRIGKAFIALWLGIPIGATVSLMIRGGEGLSISRSEWMEFVYAYSRHWVIISVEESLDRVLDRVKDRIDMWIFNPPHGLGLLVFELTSLHSKLEGGKGDECIHQPDLLAVSKIKGRNGDQKAQFEKGWLGHIVCPRCQQQWCNTDHCYSSYATLFKTAHQRGKKKNSVAYALDVDTIISTLSMLLAVILLLVGITVSLSPFTSNLKPLGLVGIHTAVITTSDGISTNARRSELFASAAVQSGILVDFISRI
jgi:hypothetical protein